jgi:hypothetical protein
MTITDILEIKDLTLLEPLFSDLIYKEMNELILDKTGTKGRILIDEEENPALFSIYNEKNAWEGCCTLFCDPTLPLIEFFEQIECEIFQENKETILDAIREYYSTNLLNTVVEGPDDLNPDRIKSIRTLIQDTVGFKPEETGLDCCCGTGVGSLIMRQQAMYPIAYDNDETLITRGIREGRLLPERTMWIDGRLVDRFLINPAYVACGFMIGEIHSFNAHIWRDIITSACAVSERILFTAGTEPEINQIQKWALDSGKNVETFESDSDPIYDRWVCYSD